jgi:hypothetical protein
MEPMPQLDRAAFIQQMRQEAETLLGQVADAINTSADGHIIAGSECQVRDLFHKFKQKTYELGLQMRTDAAEAAFSPSAGRRDGEEAAS